MSKYFSFDCYENKFDVHDTEEEAKKEAEKILDYYREDAASDGWVEDLTDYIGYGKLIASTVKEVIATKKELTAEEWEEEGYGDFDEIADYKLKEVE